MICNLLCVKEVADHGKYLSLPSIIGRNKKEVLGFIEQKIKHQIGGWKKGLLSRAGKEILLKVFLKLCRRMERFSNSSWPMRRPRASNECILVG